MALRVISLGLRGLELIFTIIVMGLIGNVIAQAFAGNPACINYTMFASVFSLLSLFYLAPATWSDSIAGHPVIIVAVDLLNFIFTLTSGIAMAARLGAHSCSNQLYLDSNEVTDGSLFREGRCREAQAATAFLWFTWACYTGSLLLSVLNARSTTNLSARPIIKKRPVMSQV